jgi:hypothetical protein
MPGRDAKGPQGAGSGTGGRRGTCFAVVEPAGEQRGAGQGFAHRGAGRGPGFRKFKKVHTSGHRFSPV